MVREKINEEISSIFDDITVEIAFIKRMVLDGVDRQEIAEELGKLEEVLA